MIPILTQFRRYTRLLSPILMLAFLLLWLRSCREEARQAQRYETNLQAREKQIRSYRLSNGQLAQERDMLTVTREELRSQIWMKDDSLQLLLKKLKDPVVTVKWQTRYLYDSIRIPFESAAPQDFQRNFSKTTQWYSLSGQVDQAGISIDSLSIPNTQRLVVGYIKGDPVVKVTNSNPHLVTETLQGQLIRLPQRHWVLGVGVSWNIYEPPTAGLFLGYKILQF